jgi:glyoxylase-like metal-dependent hydrolase (beta-lactamase superfamily II)
VTKRLNIVLLALLLLIGVPSYWLLIDNRPGDAAAKPISITQLRELAASMPGVAPTGVEMELVAFRRLPGTLFVAGSGLKRKLIGVMSFRLPVPGAGPIMIDSALNAPVSEAMGMERFDPQAWARVERGLRDASQVIITHEHADHLGGLVGLGDRAVLAKARLNAQQLPGNTWTDMLKWPPPPLPKPSISGSAPLAVAPGVVVIPAPSHTPGSQMVFVRLADSREYLFTGDIATMAQSWQDLRARSRLIGDHLAPENRAEVFAWLKTIRALKDQAPKLEVIPGHDYEWIKFDDKLRGVAEKFQFKTE